MMSDVLTESEGYGLCGTEARSIAGFSTLGLEFAFFRRSGSGTERGRPDDNARVGLTCIGRPLIAPRACIAAEDALDSDVDLLRKDCLAGLGIGGRGRSRGNSRSVCEASGAKGALKNG